MATLYLLQGSTDGRQYISLACGVRSITEYRIFTDRAGWFHNGEFAGLNAPRGSQEIANLIHQHGREPFLAVLRGEQPKWKLQQELGI